MFRAIQTIFFMNTHIMKHQIQTTVTGDSISLTSFTFSNGSGPKVYLQGNLHGPEIFGTALLVKLIQYLSKNPIISGTLTIVPQANPFGVQSQMYGMIYGRWNTQTGNNWNRIFSKPEGDSMEAILARALIFLAKDHDIVLDIHTSGAETVPYIFTSKEASDVFSELGGLYHILYDESDYYGAFDETMWKLGKEGEKKVLAATWEASSHIALNEKDLDARFEDLLHFLSSLGIVSKQKKTSLYEPKLVSMKQAQYLFSPYAGYVTWVKSVGEIVQTGEVYANVYESWSGEIKCLRAKIPMVILSKGTLQAVSGGQEIGNVVVL